MTHIHLIGIGGTGLSAIARILLEMGYMVTGSDRVETPFVSDLRSAGATIHIGHDPQNVTSPDLVVRSSAIPDNNPEVAAAFSKGIPVLKRADFLGRLMEGKTGIAVAGTHGKTTTTAMLAWMLTALQKDPSFIVGSLLSNLGINAHAGKGSAFVIEADEYDHMFLGLKPTIEVVTNVEYDHPDCYPTPADFQAAFIQFIRLLPANGTLIACAEDPGTRALINEAEKSGTTVVKYGLRTAEKNGQQMLDVFAAVVTRNKDGGFTFSASVFDNPVMVELQIPGEHNVRNALAVLACAGLLNLPLEDAAQALGKFTGTGRRFEVRGEIDGVVVIDDYAHHPTEIRTTLSAARSRYPGCRIWAVWQPHTYSRTRTFHNEFVNAFEDADEVIVTEIYAARESKQDYSAKQLVDVMPHPAHFISDLKDVSNYLVSHLSPGDVLLVLSAGDADQISTEVLTRLKEREVHNE